MNAEEARIHEKAMSLVEKQSAEIERLRAIVTGCMRSLGATEEQIKSVLFPQPAP